MVLSEEIAIKDGGKYGRWDNVTYIILITRNLHDRVRIFFKYLERSKTLRKHDFNLEDWKHVKDRFCSLNLTLFP